ncbi:hypothetical protein PO909_019539 [Leuciscus waleckii]
MTIAMFRPSDLRVGRVPSTTPQSISSSRGDTLAGGQGDLRVTVWHNNQQVFLGPRLPPHRKPWSFLVCQVPLGDPVFSFGVPADDVMSLTASQGGLDSSGNEDLTAFPTSGVLHYQHSPPMPFFPDVHQDTTGCLEFAPAYSHVILRPRPGYVPKVPTTLFRDQVVNLQALPLEEADPALALLCPVCAFRAYVDRTQCFRNSDQLFVCYGGKLKGKILSKQRLSHWTVDTIALAYQQQDTR